MLKKKVKDRKREEGGKEKREKKGGREGGRVKLNLQNECEILVFFLQLPIDHFC